MFRRRARPILIAMMGLMTLIGFITYREFSPGRARAARVAKVKPNSPNILIIIGDDHAADTLGIAGDPHNATPRIDALAKQGVYFQRAYCNSPICTASRQSLITGKLPHAVGVNRLQTPLPPSATTLGDWLGDCGYTTAAFGKMHFNSSNKHGFVDRIDTPDWIKYLRNHPPPGGDHSTTWHPFKDPTAIWLNAERRSYGLPDASMEATFFVKQATDFFRRRKNVPFAMVVGFNEPHSPFKFPDDWPRSFTPADFTVPPITASDRRDQPKVFKAITPEQTQGIQAAYYTSISYVDSKVGEILDALDSSGLAASTIVVYLGDNGYHRGHHGLFEKHSLYERAVRVPLIIRWPQRLPAGRQVDDMVELIDVLPTLLDLADVEPPPDLQGRSLAGLAEGKPGEKGRRYVFSEYLENEEAMLTDGRFKLVVGSGRRHRRDGYESDNPTPGPYEHLYDLGTDENEDVDLVALPSMAEKVKELRNALFDRITTTRNANDQPPKGMSPLATIHWCLVPRD